MNEKQVQAIIRHLADQKAPAAKIDLWPALERRLNDPRLQTSDRTRSRGTPMNTRPQSVNWLPKAAYVLFAVLLAVVLLFSTSFGRAWAQDLLRFFTRFESDLLPAPTSEPLTWVELTPGVTLTTRTLAPTPSLPGPAYFSDCGDLRALRCSVEQIRGKVNFTVQEIGRIPDGMHFRGATGTPDLVWMMYNHAENTGGVLVLIQEPWKNSPEQRIQSLGASAVVETVRIGSITGEYEKGSFRFRAGETEMHWEANAGVQTLRWVESGILYTMQYHSGPTQLDRDKLAALAESLTTEPFSARTTSAPATAVPTEEGIDLHKIYPLKGKEAAKQAGFSVREPTRLPDILSFFGASREYYPAEYKIVSLFYRLDQEKWGPNTNGLLLHEQLIPENGVCALCGFTIGEYKGAASQPGLVGPDASIEKVQIDQNPGEYVEGVWKVFDPRAGWVWESDPYMKTLRWQANGMAFELSYMGMEVTKEDMLAIAESIK